MKPPETTSETGNIKQVFAGFFCVLESRERACAYTLYVPLHLLSHSENGYKFSANSNIRKQFCLEPYRKSSFWVRKLLGMLQYFCWSVYFRESGCIKRQKNCKLGWFCLFIYGTEFSPHLRGRFSLHTMAVKQQSLYSSSWISYLQQPLNTWEVL